MSRRIAATLLALVVTGGVIAPRAADACGIKLTVKTPKRLSARVPTKTMKDERGVVAARADRPPVAAGPDQNRGRTVVDSKPAAPPIVATVTPPPAPARPAPEPAPLAVSTARPEETPAPVDQKKPDKPVVPLKFQRGEIYFTVNKSAVTAVMKPSLNRTAKYLVANPDAKIVVEGHADPSGSPDKNLTLSRARAESVRDFLVSTGIDSDRVEVQALGDTQPKYSRADGRNRRVRFDLSK